MSSRNRIALWLALVLVTLTGCGGDDNPDNTAAAPPGGAFSNGNLNGTYVFSISGYDRTNGNQSFFAVAGTLTANGAGSFTTGLVDIVDPALGSELNTGYVMSRTPTSGNYNVTADGRGSGMITVTLSGAQVQFGLDFVMASGAHGLISRLDGNGTGSGSIDLQSASVAQSVLQGSYSFGFSGVDSTTVNPLNTVGSFTLDANGNITAGVQDFTDNGNATNLQALAMQGTVVAGAPASTRMTTSAAGLGTLQYDAWVIDPSHIKFIETDGVAYLEGDAFASTGQTAFPAGTLVLALTGEDTSQAPFSAGGLLICDGNSLITAGLEDINDDGAVAEAPSIQGSFTSNGVRTQLTLNGLYNGGSSNTTGNYTFAAYPYDGGVMLLEIDDGAGSTPGISGGTLYVQSATTLGASQGYGLNLTGVNSLGEVDLIAQFTTNGNEASGLYDVNNFGWLLEDANLGDSGYWSVESNGRGDLQFPYLQTADNSEIGALHLTFYVVDAATAVFIETDPDQTATGLFLQQNASDTATPARSRFVPMTTALTARASLH